MSSPTNSVFCLPDEICQRFTTLAENVGRTHRALGRVVDEYMSEVPYGYHMPVYGLFADLYYRVTGEQISARQIRNWRHSAMDFSKHDLAQFESLTDSQLTESIKLAETAKVEPAQICEWAVAEHVDSVPAMRAHWLPQTSTEYQIDPAPVAACYNSARRWCVKSPEKLVEFERDILPLLRRFFTKEAEE